MASSSNAVPFQLEDAAKVEVFLCLMLAAKRPFLLLEVQMALRAHEHVRRGQQREHSRNEIWLGHDSPLIELVDGVVRLSQTAEALLPSENGSAGAGEDSIFRSRWKLSVSEPQRHSIMAEICIASLSIGQTVPREFLTELTEMEVAFQGQEALGRLNPYGHDIPSILGIESDPDDFDVSRLHFDHDLGLNRTTNKFYVRTIETLEEKCETIEREKDAWQKLWKYASTNFPSHFRLSQQFFHGKVIEDIREPFWKPYEDLFTQPNEMWWADCIPAGQNNLFPSGGQNLPLKLAAYFGHWRLLRQLVMENESG